jgi:predicted aconitase with swiveling domain
MKQAVRSDRALQEIGSLAKWMDSKFRIPGTDIRFGLDGILGLIPGVGDLSTFAISSYMMFIMAKNGASGYVLARMALNVIVDAIIGSIPLIGDLFDFAFKANTRNMRLMQQHYEHGRYRGSAWKVIIPVLIVLLLVVAAIIWAMYELITWIF